MLHSAVMRRRSDSADDHGRDGAEPLRRDAGFELNHDFVGCADKNHFHVALTRPRISSGVARCTSVERTTTLTMSMHPTRISATMDRTRLRGNAEKYCEDAEARDAPQHRGARRGCGTAGAPEAAPCCLRRLRERRAQETQAPGAGPEEPRLAKDGQGAPPRRRAVPRKGPTKWNPG